MRRLVVCDIDGTLIELSAAELDVFFGTFERAFGIPPVKRDWASYVATNDYAIIRTVLHEHLGRHATAADVATFRDAYLRGLADGFASGALGSALVPGVAALLRALAARDGVALTLATANMRDGAQLRHEAAGLCSHFAGGSFAEHGLYKPAILAAALRDTAARWGGAVKPEVVYLGDKSGRCRRRAGRRRRFRRHRHAARAPRQAVGGGGRDCPRRLHAPRRGPCRHRPTVTDVTQRALGPHTSTGSAWASS